MGAYRQIILKAPVVEDYSIAGEASIKPGHLLKLHTTAGQVVRHATTSGRMTPLFALENELYGKNVDTVYTSGESIRVGHAQRGSVVAAMLSNNESIAVGDYLESNGGVVAGELREYVADPSFGAHVDNVIVGQSMEASTPTAAAILIKVLIW